VLCNRRGQRSACRVRQGRGTALRRYPGRLPLRARAANLRAGPQQANPRRVTPVVRPVPGERQIDQDAYSADRGPCHPSSVTTRDWTSSTLATRTCPKWLVAARRQGFDVPAGQHGEPSGLVAYWWLDAVNRSGIDPPRIAVVGGVRSSCKQWLASLRGHCYDHDHDR